MAGLSNQAGKQMSVAWAWLGQGPMSWACCCVAGLSCLRGGRWEDAMMTMQANLLLPYDRLGVKDGADHTPTCVSCV